MNESGNNPTPSIRSRILFFVPEQPAGEFPVFQSRVWALAAYLQTRGAECLVVGTENSVARAKGVEAELEERFGVATKLVARNGSFVGVLANVSAARKVRKECVDLIRHFAPTRIYYRSCMLHRQIKLLATELDALSLFDLRGAISEEVRLRRGRSLRYYYVRHAERTTFREATRLACVSDYLKDYIEEGCGRRDVSVVPNCVDGDIFFFDPSARNEVRSALEYSENERVIVYSGGSSKWQNIELMVAVFGAIARLNANYRFLFLTRDIDAISNQIERDNVVKERSIVREVGLHEVHRFLSAADSGIVMRGAHAADKASSPIKVAEYLACGCPVIFREGLGDYVPRLPSVGAGLMLSGNKDTMAQHIHQYLLSTDSGEARRNAIKFANDELRRDSYESQYVRFFG